MYQFDFEHKTMHCILKIILKIIQGQKMVAQECKPIVHDLVYFRKQQLKDLIY